MPPIFSSTHTLSSAAASAGADLTAPETLSSEDLFAPLAALPWAMLLASAGSDAGSADNAIDIMVADPLASLCTFGDVTELH
ncbi:MAG: hypothetical protein ACRCYV_11135, partial [Aeromonas sp.]